MIWDTVFRYEERTMELGPRISVDQKVHFGRPVITGTRVPVDIIIGKLAGGMNYDEIVREYDITQEDILACLDYAAKTISAEEIRAVG
jgi:uncharacterized protein (DUF433 family)